MCVCFSCSLLLLPIPFYTVKREFDFKINKPKNNFIHLSIGVKGLSRLQTDSAIFVEFYFVAATVRIMAFCYRLLQQDTYATKRQDLQLLKHVINNGCRRILIVLLPCFIRKKAIVWKETAINFMFQEKYKGMESRKNLNPGVRFSKRPKTFRAREGFLKFVFQQLQQDFQSKTKHPNVLLTFKACFLERVVKILENLSSENEPRVRKNFLGRKPFSGVSKNTCQGGLPCDLTAYCSSYHSLACDLYTETGEPLYGNPLEPNHVTRNRELIL